MTYNSADMPISMIYPDGEEVRNTYDSRMLLDKVDNTSGYTYVNNLDYDSAGRLTLRALGNGLNQNFDYYNWDEKVNNVGQGGRLQNLTTGSLQNLSYLYDAGGNIKQITNTLAPETNIYGYDTLNRLTSWNLNGTIEDYSYDPATGNLSSKAGIGFTYNAQVTCSKGARTIPHAVSARSAHTYSYDCNGNQTERVVSGVVGSDTFTFIYDAENRLVEVKKNNVSMATFVYDGDGRQAKSVVNGVTTIFVGAHYQIENGVVTKYYFAGAQRVAMRSGSTLTYLLSDHLGSTSLTTNTSGALISELRYKPWGETRYTSGTTPTNYKYTGQREESSFGLYFYNARWYDPSLGRFAQADSIIPGSSNSQAWDRYAYTFNNPIRYNDPSGHCPVCGFVITLLGAYLGGRTAYEVGTLVIPGQDRISRNAIGGSLVTSLSEVIVAESAAQGVDPTLTAAVLRHESSAVERRLFTFLPRNIPGIVANTAEHMEWAVRGNISSMGPGQMQLRRALELEQLGYVTPKGSEQATIDALLGNESSVEYAAGMLHYISDQLNTLDGFSALPAEEQQRLILIGYNWGWTEEFQEKLKTLGFQKFIEVEDYDNETLDEYNGMQ